MRRARLDHEQKDEELGRLITESNEAYLKRDSLKRRLTRVKVAEKQARQEFTESFSRVVERIELQKVSKNRVRRTETPIPTLDSQNGSASSQADDRIAQTEAMQATVSQIRAALHFANIDEMIAAAEHLEQENYSLYTCVVNAAAVNAAAQDELEQLHKRKEELERLAGMSDDEQAVHFGSLTTQLTAVSQDLSESRSKYETESAEFREVYDKLATLFTASGCSWENAPDDKTCVSQANVMFVLSELDKRLTGIMGDIFESARGQFEACGLEARAPETDHDPSAGKGHTSVSPEIIAKQIENSRPLSIEEIQRLL
jgi:hypothetical protein